MRSLRFDAIGTRWRIDYEIPARQSNTVASSIYRVIETFDRSFSRFIDDSWVSRVRKNPGTHQLPPDAYELLVLYREMYQVTGGLVTPLIGTTLEQAGYDADYSFKTRRLTKVPAFDEVVSFTADTVTTLQPVLLDFGAAGKGYLIDKIGETLRRAGVTKFIIDGGGDMKHADPADVELIIGLENPFDTSQVIGTCRLINESVCASAGSRRHWNGYTHIINPDTLVSPQSVAAVWVKAEAAAIADMVATALFFVEPSVIRERFVFDYAILNSDMSLLTSSNFKAQVFEKEYA